MKYKVYRLESRDMYEGENRNYADYRTILEEVASFIKEGDAILFCEVNANKQETFTILPVYGGS